MTEIDTTSETGSDDIISLANKLNNDNLRQKLFDSLMCKNTPQKRKTPRFKVHPDSLSSSHSDILSKPFKNANRKQSNARSIYTLQPTQFVQSQCNSEIDRIPRKPCKSANEQHSNASSIYLLQPTQFIQSPRHSKIDRAPTVRPPQLSSRAKRKTPPPKTDEMKQKQMLAMKLVILLQKIDTSVEDIRFALDTKIVKPDGDADWESRRRRSAEFCSRFQRNYLYQLVRQITDLQKGKSLDNALQLLTSANQTLLQAFQAYHNYIPISLGDLVVDKLRTIVGHTNDLCDVHETFLNHEGSLKKDLMDNIRRNCTTILDKANKMMSVEMELRKRLHSRTSPLPQKEKCTLKKSLSDKLSMYSIPNTGKKNLLWNKTIDKLNDTARCSSVQSRYKTAGLKHRPPFNKSVPVTPNFPKPALMATQAHSSHFQSAVGSTKNEPIIKRHDDKENKEQSCNNIAWEGAVLHIKSLCETIIAKGKKEVSREQLEIILKNLREVDVSGKINNTTNRRIGSHTNGCKHVPVQSLPNLVELKTPNGKNGHNLKETIGSNHSLQSQKTLEVTGEKNTQMVWIRDEDSTNKPPKTPHPSFATISSVETEVEVAPAENESDTVDKPAGKISEYETLAERNCVVGKNLPWKKIKTSVNISNLPNVSLRKLAPLPKQKIITILQGKLQHAKVMKTNPLYCKTSDKHPWEVVNKITDRLLHDILLDICKEIQMDNIVESLYKAEVL